MEHPRWNYSDRLTALEPLTMQDLVAFYPRLLRRCRIEALVHGNATVAEAVGAVAVVKQAINAGDAFDAIPAVLTRAVQLPLGTQCIYQLPEPNADNRNSAIEICFQIEPEPTGYALAARVALLTHLLREPCFNQLRTKEQLGYIVHSGSLITADYVLGIRFLIQSDVPHGDPRLLDGRIEVCLCSLSLLSLSFPACLPACLPAGE